MSLPILVGILNDGERADNQATGGVYKQMQADMELALASRLAKGRIDRPVEFIHQHGAGLPGGTAHAVERAFAALVDAGVLLIVGPAIGDNAIVATPVADHFETPAINWSASERARGNWMFHLQVGSHEDESILMARYLAERGLRHIAVIYDRTPIGRRHLTFFEDECELVDVHLAGRVSIPPLPSSAEAEVETVCRDGVDALVYMGLGWAGREVARARTAMSWNVPALMNAAGMRGYDPAFGADIEGWAYPDMHSDGNLVLQEVLRQRHGDVGRNPAALAFGYDMGQLVAEGVARAPELTRDGIRAGLELIKVVPAADGYDGTTLGFGRFDRGALKGRYLVMRQWRGGRSIEL